MTSVQKCKPDGGKQSIIVEFEVNRMTFGINELFLEKAIIQPLFF